MCRHADGRYREEVGRSRWSVGRKGSLIKRRRTGGGGGREREGEEENRKRLEKAKVMG